jgi:HAD superfamily hydrolase (TIGR01509 family)
MTAITTLIFGAIGTITETSQMQRAAFNRAFAEAGLGWVWDAATYAAMVSGQSARVGGAARIADYASARGDRIDDATIAALHDAKTRIFQDMMARDGLPLNPGVDALIDDARTLGLKTVFASTTMRASIDAMLLATKPPLAGRFDLIMSGEDVARPKPAPDVYLAVLRHLGIDASQAIAIEDSEPSLAAALSAGIMTYAVPGTLWRGSVFEGAAAVLPTLAGVGVADLTAAAAP